MTIRNVAGFAKSLRPVVTNSRRFAWQALKNGERVCEAKTRQGLLICMRNQSGDLYAFDEVIRRRTYEAYIPESLNEHDTVIDIGAHIGCFTVAVASRVKHVLAIEPDPDSYSLLLRNSRANFAIDRITCINSAVSGAVGTAKLRRVHANSVLNRISDASTGDGVDSCVNVVTTTLGEVLAANHVSRCALLKMDCEGSEYEILLNASESQLSLIDNIILEVHRTDDQSQGVSQLTRKLRAAGFSVNNYPVPFDVGVGHGMGLMCARRIIV